MIYSGLKYIQLLHKPAVNPSASYVGCYRCEHHHVSKYRTTAKPPRSTDLDLRYHLLHITQDALTQSICSEGAVRTHNQILSILRFLLAFSPSARDAFSTSNNSSCVSKRSSWKNGCCRALTGSQDLALTIWKAMYTALTKFAKSVSNTNVAS